MGGNLVKAKSGSTWYNVKEYKYKNGSSWTTAANVKILGADGKWHETVPPNAIILYDLANGALPSNSILCNGSNSTPNLLDYYPVMTTSSSSIFTIGGSSSHNGSAHGASGSATTSTYSHPRNDVAIVGGTGYIKTSSHNHKIAAHSHAGDQRHDRQRKELQPTMFNDVVKKNAVFLNLYSNTFDGNKFVKTVYNVYLKLTNTNTLDTTDYLNTGHKHSQATLSTSTASFGRYWPSPKPNNSGTSHAHTANHYMETKTGLSFPTQNFYTLRTMVDTLYWDELPKGTVVLFTTSLLPVGFSPLTSVNGISTEGKFIYLKDDLGVNDSSSTAHSHSYTATTGSWSTSNGDLSTTNRSQHYTVGLHSHTWTDTHGTQVDHRPPFIKLYVGYKT